MLSLRFTGFSRSLFGKFSAKTQQTLWHVYQVGEGHGYLSSKALAELLPAKQGWNVTGYDRFGVTRFAVDMWNGPCFDRHTIDLKFPYSLKILARNVMIFIGYTERT